MKLTVPDRLLSVYLVTVTAALIWPVYGWAGRRIEPWILGLPFSLAWVVGWALMTSVVLILYHAAVGADRDPTPRRRPPR